MYVLGTEPWKAQPNVQLGPAYPATYVDWFNAAKFCTKLGARLPTQSEWEYACRAGTTTCYHFGENYPPANLGNYAWFLDTCQGQPYAHQVAQKLPNAFGLYDMHGNVWEWCLDEWEEHYNGIPTNGSAWDTGLRAARVIRSGFWYDSARDCRSPDHDWYGPGRYDSRIGFRVARMLR
ncbi:MAG: formylglycine-generating enzyme family protein [Planctomycetes bacterium]|nr:formylglycine-generating enzyme family protein [Planctomycetota bacterium]